MLILLWLLGAFGSNLAKKKDRLIVHDELTGLAGFETIIILSQMAPFVKRPMRGVILFESKKSKLVLTLYYFVFT